MPIPVVAPWQAGTGRHQWSIIHHPLSALRQTQPLLPLPSPKNILPPPRPSSGRSERWEGHHGGDTHGGQGTLLLLVTFPSFSGALLTIGMFGLPQELCLVAQGWQWHRAEGICHCIHGVLDFLLGTELWGILGALLSHGWVWAVPRGVSAGWDAQILQ